MVSLVSCTHVMRQLAAEVIAPKYRADLIKDPEFPDLSMAHAVHVTAGDVPLSMQFKWMQHFGSFNVVFDYGDLSIDFDYDSNGRTKLANVRIGARNYKVKIGEMAPTAPKLEKMTIETGRGGRAYFWVEV